MVSRADTTVLVTGASGYLGGHVVNTLLRRGYKVRGTVRSKSTVEKIVHLQVNYVIARLCILCLAGVPRRRPACNHDAYFPCTSYSEVEPAISQLFCVEPRPLLWRGR